MRELVIVPGHAVYVGGPSGDPTDGSQWLCKYPAYREGEESQLYLDHLRVGAERTRAIGALLLWSGGRTDPRTPLSEAEGYRQATAAFGLLDGVECDVEEHARDSFENVLFSLYRFEQRVGVLPSRVTCVGFAFKAERFRLHFRTITSEREKLHLGGLDAELDYVSVNDPPPSIIEHSRASEKRTYEAFLAAPLGDQGELLAKRRGRDARGTAIPYPYHCP